jgi:hypothetical protein
MSTRIPLAEQIAELRREAALRKNVYPTFIARGRLSDEEAADHQAKLSAAITTLEWLLRNEAAVKVALGPSV